MTSLTPANHSMQTCPEIKFRRPDAEKAADIPRGNSQRAVARCGPQTFWLRSQPRLGADADGEATSKGKAQIVYETDTGRLFYDADGAGGKGAVQFALLSGKPTISIRDFELI